MDSEAFVAASLLWVDLIVFHHKTSDTLRLALYQIINRNWQNYEQGIMSQPQLVMLTIRISNTRLAGSILYLFITECLRNYRLEI